MQATPGDTSNSTLSVKTENLLLQCKLGMKTLHNLLAAANGFHLLLQHHEDQVAIIPASIFHWSVIRYAKPFLEHKIEGKSMRYKKGRISQADGFIESIHQHLINIRHTLIAHDDFNAVSPRFLVQGIEIEGAIFPANIRFSNKSISRPSDRETIQAFKDHTSAACTAVHRKMKEDAAELRNCIIEDPDTFIERSAYKHREQVPLSASKIEIDLNQHNNWLNNDTPDFSSIHSGFIYETSGFEETFDLDTPQPLHKQTSQTNQNED